jgi:hypothetical protein
MTPKFVRALFMMVMLLGLECVSTWAALSAGAEAGLQIGCGGGRSTTLLGNGSK